MKENSTSDDFVEIRIRLPVYLANWLRDLSRDLAMEPSTFIIYVLETYRTVWEKGFEKGLSSSNQ